MDETIRSVDRVVAEVTHQLTRQAASYLRRISEPKNATSCARNPSRTSGSTAGDLAGSNSIN